MRSQLEIRILNELIQTQNEEQQKQSTIQPVKEQQLVV